MLSAAVEAAVEHDLPGAPSPGTPAGGPGRTTQRAASTYPPLDGAEENDTMRAIDATIPVEIRDTARRLDELWAIMEEPPEGVDVAANVEEYLAEASEDLILATALYLRASLEPAIETATRERARVQRLKKSNEQQRLWLRGLLAEMLARIGADKIKGALVTVSRTAGAWSTERDSAVDLSLLPDRFLKPREPAIAEIEAALKRGEDVPGFRRVQRPGVQIR